MMPKGVEHTVKYHIREITRECEEIYDAERR